MACQKPLHMKYEGMTNCLGVGEYLKRSLNSIVAIITMASLLNIPIEAQAQTKTYIASLAVMPQSNLSPIRFRQKDERHDAIIRQIAEMQQQPGRAIFGRVN